MAGSSIAVYKNTLTVGSSRAQRGAGAIYIFNYASLKWKFFQTITAPEPTTHGGFGSSVDIFDDTIAVSAYNRTGRGSIYVFNKVPSVTRSREDNSMWLKTFSRTSSDLSRGDGYGVTVGCDENVIVVGCSMCLRGGMSYGSVYSYVSNATVNAYSLIPSSVVLTEDSTVPASVVALFSIALTIALLLIFIRYRKSITSALGMNKGNRFDMSGFEPVEDSTHSDFDDRTSFNFSGIDKHSYSSRSPLNNYKFSNQF